MTLLIFKVNQLGDNVVFLPVVQHLREQLKGWRIVVATSPVAAPLYREAADGVETALFDTRKFNGAWKRPWELAGLARRARSFAADACLLGDDQGNVAHLLAWASGARATVGPDTAGRHLRRLLAHRIPLNPADAVALQNWRLGLALLDRLGLRDEEAPAYPPAPNLQGLSAGAPAHGAVVIHAGASRAYKRWPLARYSELANRLARRAPVIWIAQDDPGEAVLSSEVRVVNTKGLRELVQVIAGAKLFIGNNSAPMNIAAALGIPGVIFNGPSAPNWDPAWHGEKFLLLRDPALACQPCDRLLAPVNTCQNIAHPMACMDRWSVEAVESAIHDRLKALG